MDDGRFDRIFNVLLIPLWPLCPDGLDLGRLRFGAGPLGC
jgi:hypothetical protein